MWEFENLFKKKQSVITYLYREIDVKKYFEMKTTKFLFVGFAFFLFHAVPSTNSARIFGFFTTPSRSHFIIYESLMKELATRGHEVSKFNYLSVPQARIPTQLEKTFLFPGNGPHHFRTDRKTVEELSIHRSGAATRRWTGIA